MSSEAKVIVKCVACGAKRSIGPGEIKKGDQPFCECGGVMVPVRAERDLGAQ